jgi:hypothetical protein
MAVLFNFQMLNQPHKLKQSPTFLANSPIMSQSALSLVPTDLVSEITYAIITTSAGNIGDSILDCNKLSYVDTTELSSGLGDDCSIFIKVGQGPMRSGIFVGVAAGVFDLCLNRTGLLPFRH